jgi:hypothetical protein
MDGFWFRETSQVVIKGDFHGLVGAESVGSSGNHSDLVVEAFNGASEISPFARNQWRSGGSWARSRRATRFIGLRRRVAREHQYSRKAPAQITW